MGMDIHPAQDQYNEANNAVLDNILVKSQVPAELGVSFNNMTSVLEPGKKIPLLNLVDPTPEKRRRSSETRGSQWF